MAQGKTLSVLLGTVNMFALCSSMRYYLRLPKTVVKHTSLKNGLEQRQSFFLLQDIQKHETLENCLSIVSYSELLFKACIIDKDDCYSAFSK